MLDWLCYILLQHTVVTLVILQLVTTQSCYTGYFQSCYTRKFLDWLFDILLQHKVATLIISDLVTTCNNTKLLH